jgi:hypothetical protein
MYIGVVAVPSALNVNGILPGDHAYRWYEVDASRRVTTCLAPCDGFLIAAKLRKRIQIYYFMAKNIHFHNNFEYYFG